MNCILKFNSLVDDKDCIKVSNIEDALSYIHYDVSLDKEVYGSRSYYHLGAESYKKYWTVSNKSIFIKKD